MFQNHFKTTEGYSKKCTYFNSGYCKFTNKKNGCRYLHPEYACKIMQCKDKGCPSRHPKKCNHGEHCTYQKKCWHEIETPRNTGEVDTNNMHEAKDMLTQI